jgi:protein tyrosine phosphatase (PTP) superfamily phosphohydrolase (DUF442 family)
MIIDRAFLRAVWILITAVGFNLSHAAEGDPANFVQWRPGFVSSAQPTADYLKRAKELGYHIVINLAPPEYPEAVENEGSILAAQGVTYINIPVQFGKPGTDDYRLFTQIMKLASRKSVLVHCQINLRGSAFSYLYRVIEENAPPDESREKLNSVWEPNLNWKKFLQSQLSSAGKKVEFF